MNQIVVYDPAVADRAHAAYEANLFDRINQNHARAVQEDAVLAVATMSRRQMEMIAAQHSRKEKKLEAQLKAERKKARAKASWANISKELLLMAVCYGCLVAMEAGLLHLNLAFPLAVMCLVYGAWLARAIWEELLRNWKEWR